MENHFEVTQHAYIVVASFITRYSFKVSDALFFSWKVNIYFFEATIFMCLK